MAYPVEYVVSAGGRMSVPAAVRHRWGLGQDGKVPVIDLGDAVVLLALGGRQKLLDSALSAEEHSRLVRQLDDPDHATT